MKNLRIATKLALGFGVVGLLLVALAISARLGLSKVDQAVTLVVDDRYPKVVMVGNILEELNQQARIVRNLVIMPPGKERQDELAHLTASRAKAGEAYDKLSERVNTAEGKALLAAALEARKVYAAALDAFTPQAQAGDAAMRETLLARVRPAQLTYEQSLGKLTAFQEQLMAADSQAGKDAVHTASLIIVAASLLGLAAAVVAAVLVTRSITRPMQQAVQTLETLARGDLSVHVVVDRADEVGRLQQALRTLGDSLGGTVSAVRHNAESVATASSQIAQGNADLSQRTEEQASALQQTAATMEQLGSTVRNNADSARQANQLAQGAATVAGQGGEVVGEVVHTMQAISDSSRRIGDIIGVIDGIAFQTNILALNAAVEAARAGEQGRGFAVVAGEVRTLAQRSAEAAKEIKSLINRNVEQVEQGTSQVDRAGKTMDEIVAAIRRVSEIVGEITNATVEQSNGIGQVGDAVGQMDRVTQQNAALVEESAAAAESLRNQAQQLVQAVAFFKLGADTSGAVRAAG